MRYPKLAEIVPYKKEHEQKLRLFLEEEYEGNRNKINESVAIYQDNWDKHNDKFMRALYTVLEAKEPENTITVKGFVGVNPIFPRWLESCEFCVPYHYSMFVRATAHEVVHMIYYRKLIEEFPQIDMRSSSSGIGIIEWKLSEALDPIILNDPRIVEAIGETILDTYVCNKETLIKFNDLYQEHLKEKTSFIDFYKKARILADELLK
jgi:hypothetical protein